MLPYWAASYGSPYAPIAQQWADGPLTAFLPSVTMSSMERKKKHWIVDIWPYATVVGIALGVALWAAYCYPAGRARQSTVPKTVRVEPAPGSPVNHGPVSVVRVAVNEWYATTSMEVIDTSEVSRCTAETVAWLQDAIKREHGKTCTSRQPSDHWETRRILSITTRTHPLSQDRLLIQSEMRVRVL